MELIPILSLIVLVATISTFILAVGAYILYKIRESKGRRTSVPIPQVTEAELYVPQVRPVAYSQSQPERAANHQMQQPVAVKTQEYHHNGNGHEEPEVNERANKKFMKYTSEGYISVDKSTKTGENLKWR